MFDKAKRHVPRRPVDGFSAWQATLGYISTHYSADVMLELSVCPGADDSNSWAALVTWGPNRESVAGQSSLGQALGRLWSEVDRYHEVFQTVEDTIRQPAGYADPEWLDVSTQDILHRVLWTTRTVFIDNWRLVICYQPTEQSAMRVQMRLLARENSITVGGRGASLLEAARNLFRNAVPVFVAHSNIRDDEYLT